ncbi:MAG: hypothetical protein GY708_21225 [Actinomycetia bacterium]|nr:hypothetical protein [Actinomycetes bacterium]MCP4963447.1 hypothetical protein [Actinomycetes bacterium]
MSALDKHNSGRFFRRGLTWRSALAGIVLITLAWIVFSIVLKSQRTPLGVTAQVSSQAVVADDDGCSWEIDFEVTNTNERKVLLVAAWLEDVENSRKGILASVEPSGSTERTYVFPLTDCAVDPSTLDADRLVVQFRLRASTIEHTITAPLG